MAHTLINHSTNRWERILRTLHVEIPDPAWSSIIRHPIKICLISHNTPHWFPKKKKKRGKVTFRRSSLLTALILSLETAPSGQFSRNPRLKYFSAPLLHMIIKQAKHVNTWHKNLNYILQHTDTNYFSVSERDLSGNAFINYQMGLVNTK